VLSFQKEHTIDALYLVPCGIHCNERGEESTSYK
jgi:hypothetical protein